MNKSVMLALALSGLLVIWMLTGSDEVATSSKDTKATEETKLMSVVIVSSSAQAVSKKVTVQGQIEPNRELALKTEIDGKIISLPVTLGSRVEAGTILAKIALKTKLSARAQAVATVAYQKQELAATTKLFAKKLESGSRLSREKANLASAVATLKQIEYEIENANIKAPFAGVFDRRYVELGDYLDRGEPVVSLVDDLQLKITAMVPQQQVENLILGQQVTATLINGEKLTGPLTFISATSDKNTRSYRVEVIVDNATHRRIVGMTASLTIPVKETQGHLVNASAISLDNQGRLQVKAIDKDNKVVAYVVDIVRTDADKVWLSGLPLNIDLITLGQDFVVNGQLVNATKQG